MGHHGDSELLLCYCSESLPHGAVGWSVIVSFHGHTYFLLHCSVRISKIVALGSTPVVPL